ncbi:MAG TPA: NBR1-Ig-like domain-containing protein, partial [Flexilinea sp.]|nr:NBR1-Ig-like domain-containing protein [Flexilinea sp.]
QITKNPYCNNKIRSVNDITIPDDTEMDPGASFRKTWSMKNGGTCVWNEGYSLIFSGGDAMGGRTPVFLPNPVYPGETVEISIDLKAPNIPGDYRGYYKLRDNLGFTFGYGSYANKAFWVDIKVTGSPHPPTKTPTPTPRPTATPTPALTTTVTTEPDDEVDLESEDSFVEPLEDPLLLDDEESELDVSNVLEEGEGVNQKSIAYNACGKQRIEINFNKPDIYNITWYVTNAGSAVWNPDKYRVVNSGLSDNLVMTETDITVPATNPGEEAKVSMSVKVKDGADQSDRWLKFYLTDGNESFCEVYFSLPIF